MRPDELGCELEQLTGLRHGANGSKSLPGALKDYAGGQHHLCLTPATRHELNGRPGGHVDEMRAATPTVSHALDYDVGRCAPSVRSDVCRVHEADIPGVAVRLRQQLDLHPRRGDIGEYSDRFAAQSDGVQ